MNKGIKLKDKDKNIIYPCPYYPVGSIYISVSNVNPTNYFGGTWEQIKDRFLLAAGNSYKVGATGGEANHTLSIDEMPSHNHTPPGWYGSYPLTIDSGSSNAIRLTSYEWAGGGGHFDIGNNGGNKAHNNMPPYIAVYVWKRVS